MQQKRDDVFAAPLLYRELAYYIIRREEYDRALRFFDEALNRSPTDKRALLGRAWARSKVCQYAGALEDIATALNQEPGDLVVTAHKALNTYLCCEFEDALVLNLRMVPKRQKPDNFAMGVMHCYEAIENGIGKRAGRPLRDHFKIIRRLAWKKMRYADKPFEAKTRHKKKKKKQKKQTVVQKKTVKEPVIPLIRAKTVKNIKSAKSKYLPPIEKIAEINENDDEKEIRSHNLEINATTRLHAPSIFASAAEEDDMCIRDSLHTPKTESDYVPPGKPFHYRPLQRYTTNIQNYMAEKYLDSMYLDKIFMKDLKLKQGISSPNKSGTKKIIQMAREGFKTLCYKQELLRTRRPFYYIKYQETKLSPILIARILAELHKMQASSKKDADALINKIKTDISLKRTQAALNTVEKLKHYCDTQPKKVLPARQEYLKKMYKLVSVAYYHLFRINPNQNPWLRKRRIYQWLGIPSSREPSADSVIKQFKGVYVDWNKRAHIYEDRLRKATTSEEMCWIYHELARIHTELKQYELARVYARKCISEGRAANSIQWIVNAMMMVVKINIQQHNKNDARSELNQTLRIANKIGDENLIEYIEKALEVADELNFDEHFGVKILEQREQQIIEMMAGSGMKEEVAHLFRKMAVMPASRRMSVMPGIKLDDAGKIMPSGRKMSILPTPKEDEPPTSGASNQPRASIASASTKKDEGPKGIGFMELIKIHVD